MKSIKITALLIAGLGLSACGLDQGMRTGTERSYDAGTDSKHLSQLVAGIWVDQDGCDHWIVDDGIEGYLSARLTPDGRPVCSGVAPPNTVVGPFREGSDIPDRL